MAFQIGIPFQNLINNFAQNRNSQNEEDQEKNKKRSLIDEYKGVKQLKDDFEKAKKIIGILRQPGFLVPLIVIFVVIAIVIISSGGTASGLSLSSDDTSQDNSSTSTQPVIKIPGLTLTLEGPSSRANGELIDYKITVAYDKTAATTPLENIIVYDIVPENTSFEKADGAYTLENGQVLWPMSQNSLTFTITLRPTAQDIKISNTVYAKIASGTGIASNTNTCGGKYVLDNPLSANFGDPSCNFSKDSLASFLKTTDSPNSDFWYLCAGIESSYSPNVSAPSVSGSAWGLFQMGHQAYPELGIASQMNNEFDRGDVDWNTQATNAVSYSKLINSFKDYWQCARDLNYDGVK